MFGLKGAVGVLGHVHFHADLLRPPQRLHQDQLPGLSVRALHDEDASGVSAHDAEAQAVWAGASRRGGGRHAEQRGGGLQAGGQGQVVEGHGFGGQVAGAAVHGARVPLTLEGGRLDVADVAMRAGTLRVDTLESSPRVDTSRPSAAVVLLAQTLVHIIAAPPIWEQLVAGGAGAVVRAGDVHALVDTQFPSLVQPVHLTLIYILTDAVVRGATHVKSCITAAVLGLVHLGTARPPAERRVVHNTPLWGGCLGLMLAVRAAPVLGAGAFVLVDTVHTGSSVLAGVTRTFTDIFTDGAGTGPGAVVPARTRGRTNEPVALGTSEMHLVSNKILGAKLGSMSRGFQRGAGDGSSRLICLR